MTKIGAVIEKKGEEAVDGMKKKLGNAISNMSNVQFLVIGTTYVMVTLFFIGFASGQIQPIPV